MIMQGDFEMVYTQLELKGFTMFSNLPYGI